MVMENEDRYVRIGIIFVVFTLVMLGILLLSLRKREYEYYVNDEFKTSSKCYQIQGVCYCVVNKELIKVDAYYLK